MAPSNGVRRDLRKQELRQRVAGDLGPLRPVLTPRVLEDDAPVLVRDPLRLGALARQSQELFRQPALRDGRQTRLRVQIEAPRWPAQLLLRGLLPELEDRERNPVLVEQEPDCQAGRAAADDGDSWCG